ncbi:MAG: glycosyltransferase [Candidatus Altiarchaeota archaeon]
MKPKISIIICSRNRSRMLRDSLASLSPDEMNAVHAELVLVDNNSEDDTTSVMNSFKEKAPFPVKVLSEEKIGVSNAKNTGLKAAEGDIIVLTDDDCHLADDYLRTVVKVFETGRFQYCGGSVFVVNPSADRYTSRENNPPLIIPPNTFIGPGAIIGLNFVFLRCVLEKVGLFDPLLGPGSLFRAEDLDYVARAGMAGFTGAFVPELIVYHYHNRKPGSDEMVKILYDNDFGRGAHYVKMALMGYPRYLLGWAYLTLFAFNRKRVFTEIKGALAYLKLRIFG